MYEEPLALEVAYKVARMEIKLSTLKEEVKFDPFHFKMKIKEIEGQLNARAQYGGFNQRDSKRYSYIDQEGKHGLILIK
ncbi:hypothetical protein ACFL0D_01450 [Thermoproteota archaeon]